MMIYSRQIKLKVIIYWALVNYIILGVALVSKESMCNTGDLGLIPGRERSPGGGHGNALQYFCLENPHGQRSLGDYSPWDWKESDMTEQLIRYHFQFSFLELNFLEAILQRRKGNIRRGGKNNVKNIAGYTENERTISLKRN